MLKEERLWRITQLLMKERKVLCNQLAEEFGLTLTSIRLDLSELEKRGIAKRVYGGAVLVEPGDVHYALEVNEARLTERFGVQSREKEAIGRAAAGMIGDGETIMIDGGTTTFQVCRHLHDKRNLTVVSCALTNLWQELASKSNLQIFLTGGFLRSESFSLVGEVAENVVGSFRGTKAMLGIDGISFENGFTAVNFLEAAVKRRMVEASQELVIVSDHTKFGKVCPIPVAPISRASTLVTDAGVSPDDVDRLRAAGVRVVIADADSVDAIRLLQPEQPPVRAAASK